MGHPVYEFVKNKKEQKLLQANQTSEIFKNCFNMTTLFYHDTFYHFIITQIFPFISNRYERRPKGLLFLT